MATNALHLLVRIFQTQPSKINPVVLTHVWKTVMDFGTSGNLKVLSVCLQEILLLTTKNIFDLLSSEHKVTEDREQIFNIFRLCYWALGEYSTTICGEGLGLRAPLGIPVSSGHDKDNKSPDFSQPLDPGMDTISEVDPNTTAGLSLPVHSSKKSSSSSRIRRNKALKGEEEEGMCLILLQANL